METKNIPYRRQVFVCTNNREGKQPSCGDHKGEEIFIELRRLAKEKGLHPQIRVAQAKCLGQCSLGTNIMIYPDNVWHCGVELKDVDRVAQEIFTK